MMMASRVQPCVFCSSRKVVVEHVDTFHVECRNCGAQGPLGKSWVEAEQLWNTRREAKGDGDGQHH
jgi:hypothetical protein